MATSVDLNDCITIFYGENSTRVANLSLRPGCTLVNINRRQPLEFALPIYGFVMPLVVALTIVTNSFVVVVLSRRHLRTPTNCILLAMSVAELMTGLSTQPWLLYYYTFGGYKTDGEFGLPAFWCHHHVLLALHMPSVFHTAAIWLAVYLAVQRYIYVCVPKRAPRHCTHKKTRQFITIVCVTSFLIEVPRYLLLDYESVQADLGPDGWRSFCTARPRKWASLLGLANAWPTVFIFKAFFLHAVPCLLLLVFTKMLVSTIRRASLQRKRRRASNAVQQFSHVRHLTNKNRRSSSTTGQCELGSRRSLNATTRMLIVVLLLFLLIEIPVFLMFTVHVFFVMTGMLPPGSYYYLNVTAIFRNALIVITYPLNFAIYCGMSDQFRRTVKQLFSRRSLYWASPPNSSLNSGLHNHRYSTQLVAANHNYRMSVQLRSTLHSSNILELTDIRRLDNRTQSLYTYAPDCISSSSYYDNNNGSTNNNNSHNNGDEERIKFASLAHLCNDGEEQPKIHTLAKKKKTRFSEESTSQSNSFLSSAAHVTFHSAEHDSPFERRGYKRSTKRKRRGFCET